MIKRIFVKLAIGAISGAALAGCSGYQIDQPPKNFNLSEHVGEHVMLQGRWNTRSKELAFIEPATEPHTPIYIEPKPLPAGTKEAPAKPAGGDTFEKRVERIGAIAKECEGEYVTVSGTLNLSKAGDKTAAGETLQAPPHYYFSTDDLVVDKLTPKIGKPKDQTID